MLAVLAGWPDSFAAYGSNKIFPTLQLLASDLELCCWQTAFAARKDCRKRVFP